MTRIKNLVENIDEELCDAKKYAEMYVDFKAKNNMAWANKFKQLAQDELNHSMVMHDYTVQEIEELRKVYTPPQDMLDKWEKDHKKYVEKSAWIKQMLQL